MIRLERAASNEQEKKEKERELPHQQLELLAEKSKDYTADELAKLSAQMCEIVKTLTFF